MHSDNARYYFGRVTKGGRLDTELLVNSIREPKVITYYGKYWTFIDVKEVHSENKWYVSGKLCKYDLQKEIQKVDIESRSEHREIQNNLIRATSRFVYIPGFSGLCYMEVSNEINNKQFETVFQKIVLETNDSFFVECRVNPISDIRHFWDKLVTLDSIVKIHGKVSPPNPLFGEYWKDLKDYLKRRKASKVIFEEKAEEDRSLETRLKDIVRVLVEGEEIKTAVPHRIDIGDAVVLMAADGYGKALVTGASNGKIITVSTYDTNVNRELDKESSPENLYSDAYTVFQKINDERKLGH